MTTKILVLLTAVYILSPSAKAQKFPASLDSLSPMICRSWTLDHLVYMGFTVTQANSGTDIRLSFRTDSSAECVSVYKGKTTDMKGKWRWDSTHVAIMLVDLKGSNYFHVTSLASGTLSGFMVSYKSAKMTFAPDTSGKAPGPPPTTGP